MRSRKEARGWRVCDSSQSVPTILGVNSPFRFMIPLGTSMNDMRIGRAFSTAKAGVMASSRGSASAAPVPRKKARRGIDFLVITIAYPPHLEWAAINDTKNDGRPPLVVRRSFTHDPANDGGVVLLDAASEPVGQETLGEGLHKHLAFGDQDVAQAPWSVERGAVGQHAGGVDRPAAFLAGIAPAADAVIVLERKADRIHEAVADRALRARPVLLHALAHGHRLLIAVVLERRDIRRRGRRRRAEELLQHPFAANGRRGAVGIGGHRHDAGLPEQALMVRVVDGDTAELVAVDAL